MKTILIPILLIVGLIFSIISCDKIDPKDRFEKKGIDTSKVVIIDTTKKDTTSTAIIPVYKRHILIEDFTGHTCGNCPGATKLIDSLSKIYREKLVPIAVHAGSFALPVTGNYDYDFRCAEGNTIDNFFGNSNAGNPNGMINRTGHPITHIYYLSDWATKIASEMAKAPDAYIDIAKSYNTNTRTVSLIIKTKALRALSGDYKLVVNLTEDSIIQYQKDYSKTNHDIPNYAHRHVLRKSLNSTWGDPLSSNLKKDSTYTKSYTYVIPTSYNDKYCDIVAYLYKVSNYEVVQAEHKKIR